MKILGVSAFFHDSAAALVDGGRIVAAAEEERFSRIKHDSALPVEAIRFCLDRAGITGADLDAVVFHEKPIDKLERLLVNQLRTFPASARQFARSMGTWLGGRLWLRGDLARATGCPVSKVLFSEHHLSHAASAFLCSPFARAAIVTVDGVGEHATTAIFEGDGARIEPIAELRFPHSIGLLYSALTAYLGFEVNDGEYKVMGLAAYGRPRFVDQLRETVRIGADASIEIDPRFYPWASSADRAFTPRLEELLGPARVPGAPIEPRFADVAASIQQLTTEYLLSLASEARRLTGEANLCLAGGVALNAVANRALLDRGPFDALFVQPAAGDAGGALGAALWASHAVFGEARGPALGDVFLGDAPRDARRFLDDCALPYRVPADLHEHVADRLARGEVGAWARGRFEWGPRALGARSILADPRGAGVRDHVNAKIKLREPFRPFAPAVLADEAQRWFTPPAGKEDHTTRFMCSVAPATEAARRELPAVVHADGTGRVQHVDPGSDLGALLRAFRARTGVGALLNTSFNLKDEPICASVADACSTFLRSELDFLVVEDCVLDRPPNERRPR